MTQFSLYVRPAVGLQADFSLGENANRHLLFSRGARQSEPASASGRKRKFNLRHHWELALSQSAAQRCMDDQIRAPAPKGGVAARRLRVKGTMTEAALSDRDLLVAALGGRSIVL